MRNTLALGALMAMLLSAGLADAAEGDVAELLGALKSQEQSARLEAIDYLGLMGEKAARAVPALLVVLGFFVEFPRSSSNSANSV